MISKILEFVSIVIMLGYSLIMYIYYYIQDTIYRNNRGEISEEEQEEEQEEQEEQEEEIESFQTSSSSMSTQNNNSIDQNTTKKLYRSDEFLPKNAGDYNSYSINNIYPENLILPNNFMFQTSEFESENTEYDFKDAGRIDGAGVHLQGNWQSNGVNRPWFETCLSPMNCAIVPGNMEKFNYNQ
jgi:hypothetical protein